jgi:hypothetical protein
MRHIFIVVPQLCGMPDVWKHVFSVLDGREKREQVLRVRTGGQFVSNFSTARGPLAPCLALALQDNGGQLTAHAWRVTRDDQFAWRENMLTLNEEAGGKILLVKISGKLSKQDYQRFVPDVERLIKDHGKIRILVQMHDFHGWELGALWDDIKFDMKHFADIERLALVGESKWEAGMAAFCKPFTTAKIQYFDESKSADALTWIRAA